jgi:hypothetical protein
VILLKEIYHLFKKVVHEVVHTDTDTAANRTAIRFVIVRASFLAERHIDFLGVPLSERSEALAGLNLLCDYSDFVASRPFKLHSVLSVVNSIAERFALSAADQVLPLLFEASEALVYHLLVSELNNFRVFDICPLFQLHVLQSKPSHLSTGQHKLAQVNGLSLEITRLIRPLFARIIVSLRRVIEIFALNMVVVPIIVIGVHSFCALVLFPFRYCLFSLIHLNCSDQSVAVVCLHSERNIFDLLVVGGDSGHMNKVKVKIVAGFIGVSLFDRGLSLHDDLVVHYNFAFVLPDQNQTEWYHNKTTEELRKTPTASV